MNCQNCGKQLPENAKFCEECGTKVPAREPLVTSDLSAQAASSAQPYTQIPTQSPDTLAQGTYTRQPYTRPVYQQNIYGANGNPPAMTVGQYIITFIVSAIPLVGLILLLVWAFDSSTNLNKKNFARAYLIMQIIAVVLSTILVIIVGVFAAAVGAELGFGAM